MIDIVGNFRGFAQSPAWGSNWAEEWFKLADEKLTEKGNKEMTAEQIRDEIIRIDVRIQEAKKGIENAQNERNSLVEKLREKGFEMVTSRATAEGYAKPTQHNVELGDALILTSASLNGILSDGTEVHAAEIDYEEGTTIAFYVKDEFGASDWAYTDHVKFKI